MFILTTISDLVQIPPHLLHKKDYDNITDTINSKYANKVLQRVGLCISLYDILKTSDGVIGHGTGNVNINVEFRMIVFRPFKGEIITGVIKKCTPAGLEISTQFFENIYVPKRMLFDGTVFEEGAEGEEKTWVWRNEEAELWFDLGTVINVRVESETWMDQKEKGPAGEVEVNAKPGQGVSYSIEASITESGLGGLDWW